MIMENIQEWDLQLTQNATNFLIGNSFNLKLKIGNQKESKLVRN